MSDNDEMVTEETLDTQEEAIVDADSDDTQEDIEDIEELKAKLAKAEELANNYKVRAEKAEKSKVQPTHKEAQGLSITDQMALVRADVHEDDLEEVQEFAKFKKITIAEALKTPMLKSILLDNKEKRDTAIAANITSSKRVSGKVSDETIFTKAMKGELPESDEELARLWKLRKGIK